jgi:hypothetical protein
MLKDSGVKKRDALVVTLNGVSETTRATEVHRCDQKAAREMGECSVIQTDSMRTREEDESRRSEFA